jgi:hypothetical protein
MIQSRCGSLLSAKDFYQVISFIHDSWILHKVQQLFYVKDYLFLTVMLRLYLSRGNQSQGLVGSVTEDAGNQPA